MTDDRNWCDSRQKAGTCLVFRHRPIPTLKRSIISAARSTGMATTVQELEKLRRVLRNYKTSPCSICNRLGEKFKDPLEPLNAATQVAWDIALRERHAVHGAATKGGTHGFILSRPVKRKQGGPPADREFAIERRAFLPGAIEFIMVKLKGLFGGKSLAVSCARIDACSGTAGALIEDAVTELQIDVGKDAWKG
ncbi:MAG: hypothetical protein PHV13_03890 [Candidatus ainarchaeum sp.]|nr:hypothetical protein [Candidatus ainarchaeum sp.]